jgi:membrane protein implicated in regulation of membrane protease activity
MPFDWSWALVIAGALLILIEVALGGFAGFDLVLIGTAFVIGGGVGLWLHAPATGLVVASVLCLAYILAGRRALRARLHSKPVASNVDALLGRQGIVKQRVAPHEAGLVKLGDEAWRALPAPDAAGPFEAGTLVTVVSVDGVTLYVR